MTPFLTIRDINIIRDRSITHALLSQGYKMDDLLTSYISLMLTSINKDKKNPAGPPRR